MQTSTSGILGMKIDENTLKQLREAQAFSNEYAQLPTDRKDTINKILGSE